MLDLKENTNPNRTCPPCYNYLLEAMNLVLNLLYIFLIGYLCVGEAGERFQERRYKIQEKGGIPLLFGILFLFLLLVRLFIYRLAF